MRVKLQVKEGERTVKAECLRLRRKLMKGVTQFGIIFFPILAAYWFTLQPRQNRNEDERKIRQSKGERKTKAKCVVPRRERMKGVIIMRLISCCIPLIYWLSLLLRQCEGE